MKRKPTGFVAVCQCGMTVGALDLARTEALDRSKQLGKWLTDGCTVEPRFTGSWCASIKRCVCDAPPVAKEG